jgi:HTH-type transcriptional regulator/antitoxin HigA
MAIRLIKTEDDYQHTLTLIDELMDASPNTPEGDELELLVTLVALYEEKHYPIAMPNPVEAIKFRMEQQGLKQQDLVTFMGSKSKVSEVLNRKRPLSLSMMRALHKGLGIPAEILLQEEGQDFPENIPELDWTRFPIQEMMKLGWIPQRKDIRGNEEEVMRDYIKEAGSMSSFLQLAFRRSRSPFRNTRTDRYALLAWCLRIMELAKKNPIEKKYKPGSINLAELSKLSYFKDGPLLAREYLEKNGVRLFIVPHLNKTYLDGAAMVLDDRSPVIALTLRYDRLDNFWFCLLHELAHLHKHLLVDETNIIIDEIEPRKSPDAHKEVWEKEADKITQEALIPSKRWMKMNLESKNLAKEVVMFADQQKIHPSIVAGRIRFEKNNYRILSQFIGRGEVSKFFKR